YHPGPDAVPDHALHAPGPHLERADLVPLQAGVPDRTFAGAGPPVVGGRRLCRAAAVRWNVGNPSAGRERRGRRMTRRAENDQRQDVKRPEPTMMGACQSGGCGGGPALRMPPPPSFSEVRVNGVEIDPEEIAREIQHHPAPDAEAAWVSAARALA